MSGLNHSHNSKKAPSSKGEASPWVFLGASSKTLNDYYVKRGSLSFGSTQEGKSTVSITTRTVNIKTGLISVQKEYVLVEDCNRQMGTLNIVSLKGVFLFDSEFVFQDGSLGAKIAGVICTAGLAKFSYLKDQRILRK